MDVAGGASVSIGRTVFGDTVKILGDIFHGRTEMMSDDFITLTKNLAAVSKVTQAYHLFSMGTYYSRTGSKVAGGFNNWDAFFATLGSPLQDVQAAYDIRELQRNRKKALDEIGFLVREKTTLAWERINNGDREGGLALLRESASLLQPYDTAGS